MNGPEADAITQALRENIEALRTISELDRGFTKQGYGVMCKLETLVIDEINRNLTDVRAKSDSVFDSALKTENATIGRAEQLLAQVSGSQIFKRANV